MLENVRRTITEYGMLTEGEAVLCCLSGGADSVTLLLCLQELGYDVSAVHINHCLRGEESDRDEAFCRQLCERLGVPLTVERVNVRDYCEKTGKSTEEGARDLRYAAFERSPIGKIATAHTLSDSLETALFNLARGTGARGLCGIPPVRGRFVRPLIGCTRNDVEQFLALRGQDYVTDSSNLSDDYSRNRIRHGIVPVLKDLDPAAERAFGRLSAQLRADDEYLCNQAAKLLETASRPGGFDSRVLAQAAAPVASRAMLSLLKRRGLRWDEARIGSLLELAAQGGKLCLSGEVYALCSGGLFRIAELSGQEELCIPVTGDCEFEAFGKQVSVNILDKHQISERIYNLFTYIELDYDKIKGVIAVRNRRGGDAIRLDGRGCTKSLKKLLAERVPAEMRDKVLLLCDEQGVIAAEGFGCAERVSCDKNTERILRFGIKSSS